MSDSLQSRKGRDVFVQEADAPGRASLLEQRGRGFFGDILPPLSLKFSRSFLKKNAPLRFKRQPEGLAAFLDASRNKPPTTQTKQNPSPQIAQKPFPLEEGELSVFSA